MTEYTPAQVAELRKVFGYTPEQRAALSWAALESGAPGAWRKIIRERLSFTDPEWRPLEQIYGSLAGGFRALLIIPGSTAALGFAAHAGPDGTPDADDARRLRSQWLLLLADAGDETQDPPA